MRANLFLCLSFFVISEVCSAEPERVPLARTEGLFVVEQEINTLWQIVREITRTRDLPPPFVYFIPFDQNAGGKLWIDWQKRWFNRIRIKDAGRWSDYSGFHYKGTRIIQIDPGFFQMLPGSTLHSTSLRMEGYAYLGHEMLHYVFAHKGIPSFLEHCIMDAGGFDEAIIRHTSGRGTTLRTVKGLCENTPQDLIKGGLLQVYEAPIHNGYFK